MLSRSLAELTEIKPYREVVEQAFGPGYGEVEAFILYAFLRHFRPKRMIEVGLGSFYLLCFSRAVPEPR